MDSTVPGLKPTVDLHAHYLPAWDDGPPRLEESLKLAAAAVAAGVTRTAVTPHVGRSFGGRAEMPASEIPGAVQELQSQLTDAGIPLQLIPAAEITLGEPDLLQRITHESWLTYGGQGRYCLLESPFQSWPEFATKMIFQLSLAGVTAIIAHPERLPDVQKNPLILQEAVRMGSVLQITAGALLRRGDSRIRQCSLDLLHHGLVGLVSSDAHNAAAAFPEAVVSVILEQVGEEQARRILIENPARVLAGEAIEALQVKPTSTRRPLWNRIVGKASPPRA